MACKCFKTISSNTIRIARDGSARYGVVERSEDRLEALLLAASLQRLLRSKAEMNAPDRHAA